MNIGEAVAAMKEGGATRRAEWPPEYGNGVTYVANEDEFSSPLFFMTLENGQTMPWSPSHRDLEAEDWEAATL